MVQLYGSFTSPYVRHCRIALAQAALDVEFVEADYAASARLSPTQRVPFLRAAGLTLTDSASILRWVREQGGGVFLPEIQAFDRFLLVDTVMDTTVNLFLLERDGATPDTVPYLARQRDRVQSGLAALDAGFDDIDPSGDDGLRLACYLSWAAFRERIDARPFATLERVLAHWNTEPVFVQTHPSRVE